MFACVESKQHDVVPLYSFYHISLYADTPIGARRPVENVLIELATAD